MRNLSLMIGILFVMFGINALATVNYTSLDNSDLIGFFGSRITYRGQSIELSPKAFFVDGQLPDSVVSTYPYVFNTIQSAVEHLSDGTEENPMVLYLAPYIYWIDNPDDPEIRVSLQGGTPYGMEIRCEWLKFYGLNQHAENVVLACNRGQTIGAKGNFTMFRFSGEGTASENITFGNYCNVDLEFPLKPSLNRPKRASAIVQAQLIHCDGDKIVARNTRFISRLNLCPFVGGKRVLFDRCHFESTDDALCGTGVYLNCTLDFHSSKPFYHTTGTGAVFLNCDIRSYTKGNQYFTKADGQVAVIDTRFKTETMSYLGWRDLPPAETRNYQYDVSVNGKQIIIDAKNRDNTADLTGKLLLNAYRFAHNDEVVYNTYNLLSGNDDWDPMGIRKKVMDVQNESGIKLSNMPIHMKVTPTRVFIETSKDSVLLSASTLRFGNYHYNDEPITWSVAPEHCSLVRLEVGKDWSSCLIVPTNTSDETVRVKILATTSLGLEAVSVITVSPSKLAAPAFRVQPKIVQSKKGILSVNYKLDTKYPDQSEVTWYRCRDAAGKQPIEVAVSRFNTPLKEYKLSAGDSGYYILVAVSPKHLRSDAGSAVFDITKERIVANDIKGDENELVINFRNISTRNQRLILPGFWRFYHLDPEYRRDEYRVNTERDAWHYGKGSDGAANETGLLQGRSASMSYTPVHPVYGDMKLELVAIPFKTAGQGFSVAHLYMDVLIKYDANAMTGYGLRFIRTTKFHDAVDCLLVKYEKGKIIEISEPVSTSCFRPTCFISVEVKGDKLIATARLRSEHKVFDPSTNVFPEVHLEATIEPTKAGGFGIEYNGGSPTMIKEVSAIWK